MCFHDGFHFVRQSDTSKKAETTSAVSPEQHTPNKVLVAASLVSLDSIPLCIKNPVTAHLWPVSNPVNISSSDCLPHHSESGGILPVNWRDSFLSDVGGFEFIRFFF